MYLSHDLAKLHIECLCNQITTFLAISRDADAIEGKQTVRKIFPELVSGDHERTVAALSCLLEMLKGPQDSLRSFFDPTTSSVQESDINVDNIPSL